MNVSSIEDAPEIDYFITHQDLRSTAIYGAKIIIFKILPLYIVPLRKS